MTALLAALALASFRPAPGWTVERVATQPGLVVAVTRADERVIHPFTLFGSFKRLSRDGVLVWAMTLGRHRQHFPVRSQWPPRLPSFSVQRGWEGQPAPNVQQRVWVAAVGGWDLDVRVYFATQHPSRPLLAAAQRELDRLQLP
jgi:hypothetical protein